LSAQPFAYKKLYFAGTVFCFGLVNYVTGQKVFNRLRPAAVFL
jgi:hypothetical protein